MKKIFIFLFFFWIGLSSNSYAAEFIFNSKGELIELKDDGTWVNHGDQKEKKGFVFSIIGAKPSTFEWDGITYETCRIRVKLVNNTQFNIKKVLLVLNSVDDLGEQSGNVKQPSFYKVRIGESMVSDKGALLGKCEDFKNGTWNVFGGVNQFGFQVYEKGISTDDLFEFVKFSNSGIIKFTNTFPSH